MWQAYLKKTEVELNSLDADMLPMAEKSIGGGISHVVHRYTKVNSKHVKDYDSNTKPLYLMYWDVSNLYG